MKQHELKCWPEFFDKTLEGLKPFELRKDDRGFKVGDILVLKEWSPDDERYTEFPVVRAMVTYILKEHPGLAPGYVVLGIEKL